MRRCLAWLLRWTLAALAATWRVRTEGREAFERGVAEGGAVLVFWHGEQLPIVFQWNKRDASDALPVSVLESTLNPKKAPSVPAVASRCEGVHETHSLIVRAVLERIRFLSQANRSVESS